MVERDEFEEAAARAAERAAGPVAVTARYDGGRRRIRVGLSTGIELAFPPDAAEGLAGAEAADLAEIEITPSGLGLHWPRLDADLYLPALLEGMLGSRAWMAARMGIAGGRARSPAKAAAARENGRRGGRPRKRAAG
jgi:hypothetical protein